MNSYPNKKSKIKKRLLKRPLILILLVSILLHLLAGLFLGSWKVFTLFIKDEAVFEVAANPQSIQPKQRHYKLQTMRSQRTTTIATQIPISVNNPTDLDIPNINIQKPKTSQNSIKARGKASSLGSGIGSGEIGFATLFGNTAPLAGAMEGTFIDLKQDKYREDTVNASWLELGKDYLSNFKLREFRKCFNAEQKLYATHFYIPIMPASEAPKAYGVESLVQPNNWIAAYEGQFRSMAGGKYRFVGTADDILIVGVDSDIVLSAGFTESNPSGWKPNKNQRFDGPPVSEYLPKLTVGDWFDLPAGQPVDLNIIIGEIPGGEFACYLFIEKKGMQYEQTAEGRPILPIFKLKDFSRQDLDLISNDNFPKLLDGEAFGYY